MNVQHRFPLHATCPVNGEDDWYVVTVLADRLIPVERVWELAERLTFKPIFQEDLTVRLAAELDALVRTVGLHGSTRTKCHAGSAEPPAKPAAFVDTEQMECGHVLSETIGLDTEHERCGACERLAARIPLKALEPPAKPEEETA